MQYNRKVASIKKDALSYLRVMLAQGIMKNPKSWNNSFIARSMHFHPLARAPGDSVPVTRISILNMLKLF